MVSFDEGIKNTVIETLVAAGLDRETARRRAADNLALAITTAKAAYAGHTHAEPERCGNPVADGIVWSTVLADLRQWAVATLLP